MQEVQLVLPLSADELPGPDLDCPSGTAPSCAANYAEHSLTSEANGSRMLPPCKPMTHHRVRSRSRCHWTLSCQLLVAGYILPHLTVMRYRTEFFTINSGALVVITQSSISLRRFTCFGLKRHHLAIWILSRTGWLQSRPHRICLKLVLL